MKKNWIAPIVLAVFMGTLSTACNNADKNTTQKEPALKEENVTYTQDSTTMNGFVVYDENIEGKRPAIIVVHEWWGLNDYARMRARELAKLGYIAMAIDLYGNGKQANDPTEATALATPFYASLPLAKSHFDAALEKLKSYPQTDPGNMAAIGYCFGGAMVLNMARAGEDLKGVVSFHGNLTASPLDKEKLKAAILVCHGNDDKFVLQPEVEKFKHDMDSIGANYTFKSYDGATHAFTNPDATAMGEKFGIPIAYNAAADSASWNDMKTFFSTIFKK